MTKTTQTVLFSGIVLLVAAGILGVALSDQAVSNRPTGLALFAGASVAGFVLGSTANVFGGSGKPREHVNSDERSAGPRWQLAVLIVGGVLLVRAIVPDILGWDSRLVVVAFSAGLFASFIPDALRKAARQDRDSRVEDS